MGVKLFMQAIRLVLNNWRDALRITGLLYFVPVIAAHFVFAGADPESPPPLGILVVLVTFVCSMWIAVAWHRFILLDERPAGLLPPFEGGRVLSYFGYSLLLGFIAVPVVVVVSLVVGGMAAIAGPPILVIALPIMVFIILTIGYRLGLILPASSVGKPLKLNEAWAATSGANGDVIVLALLSAGGSLLLTLPTLVLVGPLAPLGQIWDAVSTWFAVLVGVSILTTLYGVFIEGRALPD
jgi:hypothetical protein